MVALIQQLLYTNNCVIIPKFGAFIGNYEPATIHLQENKVLPPSKLIAFNRSLQKNDGLLLHYVMEKNAIDYHEAELMINNFAEKCNKSLVENRSLLLAGIGIFKLDTENNIQFQPYHTTNYNLESFGLPTLSIYAIQRIKDNEAQIKSNYQRKLHPEYNTSIPAKSKTKKWTFWMSAAVVLAAIAITSIQVASQNKVVEQNQSSLLPSLSNTPTLEPVATPTVTTSVVSETTVQETTEATANEVPSTSSLPVSKSYIVIGTYFDEARAGKLKSEVEAKGYTAVVSKDTENGIFRTTVQVASNDVEHALQQIKSDINTRAWIFCIKCNLN
ncbi:MAG TPA: hypothetical protein PKG70_05260 [Chitinophagales bacterium]|nr:hypothetical protein [Chitinophagales bacterium]